MTKYDVLSLSIGILLFSIGLTSIIIGLFKALFCNTNLSVQNIKTEYESRLISELKSFNCQKIVFDASCIPLNFNFDTLKKEAKNCKLYIDLNYKSILNLHGINNSIPNIGFYKEDLFSTNSYQCDSLLYVFGNSVSCYEFIKSFSGDSNNIFILDLEKDEKITNLQKIKTKIKANEYIKYQVCEFKDKAISFDSNDFITIGSKKYNINSFDNPIEHGGEGTIYKVPNRTDSLIKIYSQMPGKIQIEKIKKLMSYENLPSNVAVPRKLVYDSNNNVIGFEMKKMDGDKITIRHIDSMTKSERSQLFKEIIKTCTILMVNDIYPIDIKFSNLLLTKDKKIQLLDVDSCTVGKYLSTSHTKVYQHKEMLFTKNERLPYHYQFSLFIVYAKLMMSLDEGVDLYDGLDNSLDSHTFPIKNPQALPSEVSRPYMNHWNKDISETSRKILLEVFHYKKIPNIFKLI